MDKPMLLQRGPLLIDLSHYRVLIGREPIMLSYREYALLLYLATHVGHVVSKRRLLEEGLGRHDVGGLRMVDEHIRHLKFKLERHDQRFIEEAEGGWRFVRQEPVTQN